MKSLSRTTQQTFQIQPFVFILSLTCLIIAACEKKPQDYFQGYVEGEYLYISSPIGGRLESLPISKGMTVAENDLLFQLDRIIESAGVAEAKQNLLRAENKLANLSKGLRPSEIDAIQAKLDQALASYDLAKIEYARREKLLQEKVIAQGALDQTRAEMEKSSAAVSQLQAELKTAEADLAEAVEMKYMCMSDTVKSRYRWRYNRARALEANLRKGIDGLRKMAPSK